MSFSSQTSVREFRMNHIFRRNRNGVWPKSLYFGRYRGDLLQIRVSDYEKEYTPHILEITILVDDEMTKGEVLAEVRDAIEELTKEEDQLLKEEGND